MDVIHVRRPDYQSIDAVMHVDGNRSRTTCGLVMVCVLQSISLRILLLIVSAENACCAKHVCECVRASMPYFTFALRGVGNIAAI